MAEAELQLLGSWNVAAARPDSVVAQRVTLPHDGGFLMRLDQPMLLTEWRLVWVTPPPAGLEAEVKRLRGELDAIEQECRERLAAEPSEEVAETARAVLAHMGLTEEEETDWDAAGYDA